MSYIIHIDELRTKLNEVDISPVVVDVRKERTDGSIQGAIELNVKQDLSGKSTFFASPEKIANILGSLGINEQQTVIFVDDGSNRESAKALFALYQLGHKGGLHILQGGYPSWVASAITLDDLNHREATTYHYHVRKEAVLVYEDIKEMTNRDDIALIDSRSYERYAGMKEPKYEKAGHIPGAVNYHAKQVFDEAGKWHHPTDLKKHFSALADKEKVVASCGSGGSACLNAVALLEAGFDDVALYPGGYSEWLRKGEAIKTVEDKDKT